MIKIQEKILAKVEKLLADLAFLSAKSAANSACLIPLFEPEQPEELEMLKRNNHQGLFCLLSVLVENLLMILKEGDYKSVMLQRNNGLEIDQL